MVIEMFPSRSLYPLHRRGATEHAPNLERVETEPEPPFFQTEAMGSLVYASRCKQRNENVLGMIALETIGFYTDAPNSQQYPPPLAMLYPSTGNFIAFVGNLASLRLVQRCVGSFRAHAQFPSEAGVAPESIPGVGWSDHWSFWQQGYPAIMVTDTAPFRYPHYHQPTDTPDKLDYDRTARVVAGLSCVVSDLAKQAE
ncbi:M28 family peptidase [Fontivita pretiosa]|uniref:M28 family peptidase n=1 Tax=Fontivita pretiosa TaxID=2989684 RepID=UPI003D169A03